MAAPGHASVHAPTQQLHAASFICHAPSRLCRCSRTVRAISKAVQQEAGQAADSLDWQPTVARTHRRRCLVHDHSQQLVPYHEAWQWQKQQVERMTAPTATAHEDQVIILQHPPVYTLGAGSTTDNVLFDPETSIIPTVRTERGGEVTYHGPGQLVLYPLLNLAHHRQDLHWYMRALEEVIIRALWEVSGLKGERVPGLTGVWVDGAKVAAIGVRAKRWVTYHGLALNVCPNLSPFQSIIPCGIDGKPVTSVLRLLNGQPGVLGGKSVGQVVGTAADAHLTTSSGPSHALPSALQSQTGAQGLQTGLLEVGRSQKSGDLTTQLVGHSCGQSMATSQPISSMQTWPSQPGHSVAVGSCGDGQDSGCFGLEGELSQSQEVLNEYSFALLEACADVFGLELVPAGTL